MQKLNNKTIFSSLLLSLTILYVNFSEGKDYEQLIRQSKCKSQLSAAVLQWGATGHWIQKPNPRPKTLAFRSRTSQIARWVEVRITTGGFPHAILSTPTGLVSIKWTEDCQPLLGTQAFDLPTNETKYFTDRLLKRLLASKKAGILYIWSPRYLYSVSAFKDLQKVGKKLGLPVLSVVDPVVNDTRIKRTLKKHSLPSQYRKLASVELHNRGVTVHYPVAIVYDKGRLSRHQLKAAHGAKRYEQFVRSELRRLRRSE